MAIALSMLPAVKVQTFSTKYNELSLLMTQDSLRNTLTHFSQMDISKSMQGDV